MTPDGFGGAWTEEKLGRLGKYLQAYMAIFAKNPRARYFRTSYVDAFAGRGYRERRKPAPGKQQLLFSDQDAERFQAGSARIALAVTPPFDEYVFVDYSRDCVRDLEDLKAEFPALADRITIVRQDANQYVRDWCAREDWSTHRAVLFLDPFGMQVDWETIEAVAKTQAIDLWLLFPLGQAVMRLLTKSGRPPRQWAERLTRTFGSEEWKDAFYGTHHEVDLFGGTASPIRTASMDGVMRYFLDRLRTVFAGVAEHALELKNSKGVSIFMLCFAAGNPRGAKTAVKIADYLLRG